MLFAIIAFLSMFPYSLFEDGKMELVFSSNAKEIAKIIKTEPMLQNKKLYDITWWTDIHPGATRYLAKDGIKVYDRFNNDKLSFNSSKKIFEMQRNPIDFDAFMEKMDKNGYIISTHNLTVKHVFKNTLVEKKENGFVLTTQNKKYYLKEIYNKTLKKGNVTFNVYKVYEI